MKYILKGSTSNGSHSTPQAIENLRYSGAVSAMFTYNLYFSCRQISENGNNILEPKWEYMVLYNGIEVYFFDSEMPYIIEDEQNPATIEQCEDIAKKTYKELQESWQRRKNEGNFFQAFRMKPSKLLTQLLRI
ncbi:MAG: hypothetical protein IPI66_12235 [Chitinophagaceae bacterium]|nr:hypothetical protein [Chitinophagaceae bacterium]